MEKFGNTNTAFKKEDLINENKQPRSAINEDLSHGASVRGDMAWSPPQSDDYIFNPCDDVSGSDTIDTETDDSEENYGIARIREIMQECQNNLDERPALSYIALIGMAIQTAENRRLLLSDIYQWIMQKFPYFKSSDRSWRNSVRHNLSLNECFVKTGRSDNGKGNYWIIHAANVDDFSQGDFRRRKARIKVRQSKLISAKIAHFASSNTQEHFNLDSTPVIPNSDDVTGWVDMTSWSAPVTSLVEMFGADAILAPRGFRKETNITGEIIRSEETGQFTSSSGSYQRHEDFVENAAYQCGIYPSSYNFTNW